VKLNETGLCACLKRLIKKDYKDVRFNHNNLLPDWLNLRIYEEKICLFGVPNLTYDEKKS
jgi:hypothetical protein